MLSSLAGWRVSLRRTRADWPIVLAASLTMMLATTILAAGPIYSAAVSVAGLRQLLAEAPVKAANVRVSAQVPLDGVDSVDQAIAGELQRLVGRLPAELARFATGDGFALPGQGSEVRDLALPGFADGVERHATLVSGAWPVTRTDSSHASGTAASPIQVAISDTVASLRQLAVGDRLDLVSRRNAELVLPVTISAVFQVDDPTDPFWWSDARTFAGLTESDQYRTYGPFLMTRNDLLDWAATSSVAMSWRLLPAHAAITIDEVSGLRARLDALPERLRLATAGDFSRIDTDLPQTLADASRALLVSRTAMLLLMGQLALLGGYSILLTAGLLSDHRRVETALLRSRGAGPGQVTGLALVEGLLLAAPAVALGPWCALLALAVFDRLGPLAQVGLSVPLHVTSDAYLAAGVAGVACIALLALPALFSARAFRAEQRSLAREERRPLAQRLGIDLALLAVAAIALWQLRLYGAPLTRTVQGALGPDPLLIAAPALGLLAGAVVAIRLLPRLAEGAEGLLARRRGLVGSLGSFQLARRPLRYTRSALMLMLAMSIGVFAVSYSTTWTDSQRSQADQQVGADLRVVPSRSARAVPDSSLAAAYAALPGVEQAMPVERYLLPLNRLVRATLLALDARTAPGLVRFRADQATSPLAELLAPLAAARPATDLAATDPAAAEVPVLVNRQTLDAMALAVDDTFEVDVAGAQRRLRIVGLVESFPTTDGASPLVIADLPTLASLRQQAGQDPGRQADAVSESRRPDEWWLDLAERTETADGGAAVADQISRVLNSPPFSSVSVTTAAGRLRSLLNDPVPVGIIGALGLGAIAATLFALIGLAVAAAVSARQRQTEFALLRALGLSRRQLAGWLWLENGSVALVSLLAGTLLGVLISWVVLPSVTVTSDGLPPSPPLIVTLPLATIAVLELITAAALAAVVVVLAAVLRRLGIGNILRLGEE
jgi:hypothetical protein